MLLLSKPGDWPQVYSITQEDETARVRVYLWDLTHDSARDDFKFQLTGVTGNTFEFEVDVRTIVLGYYAPMNLYLAADSDRRRGRFGSSAAIQVRQGQLEAANRDGMAAFSKRNTDETAIVVRADQVATYLLQAAALHEIGDRANGVQDVNTIAAQIGASADDSPTLSPRDRKAVSVVKVIRSANFTRRVRAAYDHQCCACGLQLDLVEAAHIIPAGAALSSDDTRNGLCLCPVHHDAYDDGLIGIDPGYKVMVSAAAMAEHAAAKRAGGAAAFEVGLRPSIILPYAKANHPDPAFLRAGLAARNWRA